jgi:hypothetical protein
MVAGIDFVRCRACGDHRRVISGRHLSKHGIDRETYMEEYALRPDELIAKDVRNACARSPYMASVRCFGTETTLL